MPRQRDPRRDKAFEIWKKHNGNITNRAIAEQLGVPEKTVGAWKSRDEWDNKLKVIDCSTTKNECSTTNNECSTTKEKDDISWVEIENEYVTDIRRKPCTLEELSKKYNIPFQTIKVYAAKNNWTEKRNQHRTNVVQKTAEKTAEMISDDLSAVTARHLRVSDKLISIIEEALEDENELYKYVEKLRQGYGKGAFEESIVVDVKDALNDAKLLNIVQSLEKLQKMQRQTLGILDAKDQHKIEMDKRKMGDDDTEFEDDGFLDALDGKVKEVWDDEEA
ncbi:phage terminase small subunit-related protein [Anoxybacillus rupiensis]|uniref:Phage terminase small subunit-related protein n=1 Tax=Anoxybacteroides rupiense TaxID=311460 RepID=A0ABD5IT28_9BACL|nr:phage terminase small subunit-related protein [Anoxybacillus rupiensis]